MVEENGMMPEMSLVDSSSIEAIGYDSSSQELYVRFLREGRTYVYYSVEEWVFLELKQAESKGSYVNSRIKPHYSFGEI